MRATSFCFNAADLKWLCTLFFRKAIVLAILPFFLSACGFFTSLSGTKESVDSAPSVKLDARKIKDAVPRQEPKSRGGNRSPYTVLGRTYKVVDSAEGYRERGYASWYGVKFHGRTTSNGEIYDMYAMTAAHKHLPLPSYVKVTNLENGSDAIVRVNDRGPFHGDRIIDLSYSAATKLGILRKGTAKVEIEIIDPKKWLSEKKKKNVGRSRNTLIESQKLEPKASHSEALVYLQVAAFQNLSAAQSLQHQLLSKIDTMAAEFNQYNVVIHPAKSGDLYRVRIGPVHNKRHLTQLKQHASLVNLGKMHEVVELQ